MIREWILPGGLHLLVIANIGLGLGFNFVTCAQCKVATLGLIVGPFSVLLSTGTHLHAHT